MDDQHIPVDTARLETARTIDLAQRVLIARMTRGDEGALVDFYRATVGQVYAFAVRIVGAAQADEVVADVYLQIWQQANRFDSARGNVGMWLFTVARTRALDALRRRDPAECHPQPQDLRPDLYSHHDDPQNLLLALERDHALHAAVGTLSAEQRRVVELAFFSGLSHGDIARKTGWPLGSVKTMARQALQRLHGALRTSQPVAD